MHLEKGIESVAYDVWSSSFNFMGLGCLLNSLKKVDYQSYVRIKKRKDSKVTIRFLALSNNFTTDHNHLEIQAHDSRGDKIWKIYFNPCKHLFILNIRLFLRSPATSISQINIFMWRIKHKMAILLES